MFTLHIFHDGRYVQLCAENHKETHTFGKTHYHHTKQTKPQPMTIEEFDTALTALGWRMADFCRHTGLHRNTPSRWRNDGVEIPEWVPKHLALLLEVRRLHETYINPPRGSGAD